MHDATRKDLTIPEMVARLKGEFKNVTGNNISNRLRTLGIKQHRMPVRPASGFGWIPGAYSYNDFELLRLSLEESGGFQQRPLSTAKSAARRAEKVKAAMKAALEKVAVPQVQPTPAVPIARVSTVAAATVPNPTWKDFEAATRKLAHIAKALRITLVEIEHLDHGDPKIRYEQNNSGEIKL